MTQSERSDTFWALVIWFGTGVAATILGLVAVLLFPIPRPWPSVMGAGCPLIGLLVGLRLALWWMR